MKIEKLLNKIDTSQNMTYVHALDRVLDNTRVREMATDLYISRAPPRKKIVEGSPVYDLNERERVGGWLYFNRGTGKVREINLSAEQRNIPRTELVSADEVYRLAKEYGGSRHLRIGLQGYDGVDAIGCLDDTFFNFSFFNWKTSLNWGINRQMRAREEKRAYEARDILRKIFDMFHIEYSIDTKKEEIHAPITQREMRITPEGVRKAYEILREKGDVPCIANGGIGHGFHLFQYLNWDKENVNKNLLLNIEKPVSQEDIPHGSLELIAMTLERHGFSLTSREWVFSGSRREQVKNSKRKDELRGFLPDEWICEEEYKGRVNV